MEFFLCAFALMVSLLTKEINAVNDPRSFLIRYALGKARESCVGEKVSYVWEDQVRNVVDKCKYNGIIPIRPVINVFHGHGPHLPFGPKVIGNIPPLAFLPDHLVALGTDNAVAFDDKYILPHATGAKSIHKRDTREKRRISDGNFIFIQNLIEGERRVEYRLSNITCVMIGLNVIDSNGNIQYRDMAENTASLHISPYLKKDLIDGLEECTKFASCLGPSKRESQLIPFELKRALAFTKCAQIKRQIACVKKDIRENLAQSIHHDLKPVPNLDDITQRMLDVLLAEDIDDFESLLL